MRVLRGPVWREAERLRLGEIRQIALGNLKRAEEWASKLERANRLRALAVEFESKQRRSLDDVVDAAWIRLQTGWTRLSTAAGTMSTMLPPDTASCSSPLVGHGEKAEAEVVPG